MKPIKVIPAFKDYIWGGQKLRTVYGKHTDLSPLAESWELSCHPDGLSTVAGSNGKTLDRYIAENPGCLGTGYDSTELPILIKLIDAKSDLSVQVHPSDEYALSHEGEYGKTEMWYVLDCEENASLFYGFERPVTKEEYAAAIRDGRLTDILHRVQVKPGDVFFIPAGTVHAIGAGILICEIQQNSNTTYRVYDYNRRDKDGNLRPLHVEKALEVSCTQPSPPLPAMNDGVDVLLASCEYFHVRRLRVSDAYTLDVTTDSFVSLVVTGGEGRLVFDGGEMTFVKGDSLFIPAQNGRITVEGSCELIHSTVNKA